MDYLRDDWEKLNSTEEYEIMKKYATNVKLITFVYLTFAFVGTIMFMLITLVPKLLNIVLPLNESRPIYLPYNAYYFVDKEKYYFYIMFHIIVCIQVVLIAAMAHDCMFLVYSEHICSLFAVVGFHLETVSRNDRNDAGDNRPNDQKIYDRKIAISVNAHWRALRLAEILEDISCIGFAMQMLIMTVTMSITLLQIALQINENRETLKYMIYISAQLLQTFCFSLQGQRLIDHSVQLRDKIYNSFWYEIPAESRRLFLFVMRRSMQPCFLSAGKIYIFSLKTFSTVNVIYEIYSFEVSFKNTGMCMFL
ncbi:PREDICTED: putative odorant receptor 85d [Trachymyrmex cornetzi]|uniref:putative odorant receptor 85d n=1 Tax=Trachymyrmex cornetzi TaxID=471704 RepID=UPI00084F7D65|nr:PREDICTED: putative odorant receptor 85d [Trachymyrmex cornetzi]